MTILNPEPTVTATLSVRLKPWNVPSFATRFDAPSDASSIPVADLDDDALEALVLLWVREVYRKAGRRHCPFNEITRAAS